MPAVTIYHNPACGTSRNTLAMIRNAGTDPCAVVQAFGPASNLPTPINATQAERGARVVAGLFNSNAAEAAPKAVVQKMDTITVTAPRIKHVTMETMVVTASRSTRQA